MSASEAGFVQTCFFTGFAVSMFLTSWFSDHTGAKRKFFRSAGYLLRQRWVFLSMPVHTAKRCGPSRSWGFPRAARISPQSCWYRKNCRASGVEWVLASMSAGYVGSISLSTGFTATHGYEVVFMVCAAGSVLAALFGTSAAKRSANIVSNAMEGARPWSILFRDRRSMLLTMGCIGHSWELFGVCAWAPAFLIVSLGDGFALGAVGLGIAIAIVLLVMSALGTACSFGFGWSGPLPATILLLFAALYGFGAIGDSAVLSTVMAESVP